jgi:hypothetical protein
MARTFEECVNVGFLGKSISSGLASVVRSVHNPILGASEGRNEYIRMSLPIVQNAKFFQNLYRYEITACDIEGQVGIRSVQPCYMHSVTRLSTH